jgi:DNA-binding transcriptional regulator PaaX
MVTLEMLRKAFRNSLGKRGMAAEEIDNLAEYVINFFGYNEYVIDNKLEPKDRDVFYMLEEEGILTTLRDEVTIQKGKVWRIHFWILNAKRIEELAKKKDEVKKPEEFKVYDNLAEDIWDRNR